MSLDEFKRRMLSAADRLEREAPSPLQAAFLLLGREAVVRIIDQTAGGMEKTVTRDGVTMPSSFSGTDFGNQVVALLSSECSGEVIESEAGYNGYKSGAGVPGVRYASHSELYNYRGLGKQVEAAVWAMFSAAGFSAASASSSSIAGVLGKIFGR